MNEIIKFIHEYEKFRKKNPLKDVAETINFETEIFEYDSYVCVKWSFKYGNDQTVDELPTLYSITIYLSDCLSDYVYAHDDSVGIRMLIKWRYFVFCKKILFHFFDWIVRNFNNIETKDIHRNAKILIKKILTNY